MRSLARTVGIVSAVFSLLAALPARAAALHRTNHTATLMPDGNLLLCGGENPVGTFLNSCAVYYATAQYMGSPFAFGAGAGTARSSHTATVLPNGEVLFAGGNNLTGALALAETFNPRTYSWSDRTGLTARADHTATLLKNGKVLVAGGRAAGATLKSAQLYDFLAGWTAAPDMAFERSNHTATSLSNGKVFLTGGWRSQLGDFLPSSEVYDPDAGSFFAAAPLNVKRAWHTATALGSGKVLISGGFNGINYDGSTPERSPQRRNYGFLKVVELYDPASDTMVLACTSGRPKCDLPMNVLGGAGSITPDGKAAVIGGLGNIDLARYDNASLVLKNTGVNRIAFPGFPGPGLGYQDISGATLTVKGGTVDLGIPGLAGTILGGVLDISSASIAVTSGTFLFESINPQLDVFDPAYRPGLRAYIYGALVANGKIETDLTFTVGNGRVAASTAPFYGYGSPEDTLTAKLGDQTLSIVTSSVTISSMVFANRNDFDPTDLSWSFGLSLGGDITPVGHVGHTATLLPNADIVVYGGQSPEWILTGTPPALKPVGTLQPTAGFFSYVPFNAAWRDAGAQMRVARANHTATVLPSGKLLLAGGSVGASVLDSAEIYDPAANAVALTGRMSAARDLHTATLLPNGRVLVAGGYSTNAVSTGATSGCELYDPAPGRWVQTGPLNQARYNHSATLLANGNVLVAGGYNGGLYLDTAEIYYSTAGRWVQIPSFTSYNRASHGANLLQDGKVLLSGGFGGIALNSSILFDPSNYSWTAAGMNVSRYNHAATTLRGNTVVAIGGNDGAGHIQSVEVFTPEGQNQPTGAPCGGAGGCWTLLNSGVNYPSYGYTGTLTPNGEVYLAGGEKVLTGALATTALYDNDVGTVTVEGNLAQPRKFHAAALLQDGNVIVTGGESGGASLSSMEMTYHTYPPDARRPVISSMDATRTDRGLPLTVYGSRFLGLRGEASGGYSPANSAENLPRITLQLLDSGGGTGAQQSGGYLLDISSSIYNSDGTAATNSWSKIDSSITVTLPNGNRLPYGWYHVRVLSAAKSSVSNILQIAPLRPTGLPGAVASTVLGTSSITWSWGTGTLGGAYDGYEVHSATTAVLLSTVAVAGGPAFVSSFTQTGLGPNTAASVAIAAFNLGGTGSLAYSATVYTLAAQPQVPVISSVTDSGLRLDWNANGNPPETLYEISQSADLFSTDFSTPVPTTLGLATTTALISNLTENTTYSWRIRAFNGAMAPSPFSMVVTTLTTSGVRSLAGAAQSSSSILWLWTSVANAAGYRIYNATTSPPSLIGASAANSFLDTGLNVNSRRVVAVTALTGSGEGPLSAQTQAYTLANAPLVPAQPLTSVSTGGFVAFWYDNGNPQGTRYNLQVQSSSNSASVLSSTGTGLSAMLADGLPNAGYEAFVHAVNADGIATADVPCGSTYTLANTPGPITVQGTSPSTIEIAWTANGNPNYTLYQVTASSDGFAASLLTPIPFSRGLTDTSASVTGLLTSTTYSIRVTARNQSGRETSSVSITTTTYNGGGPPGSLAGTIDPAMHVTLTGTIGSGRAVYLSFLPHTFPNAVTVFVSPRTGIAACGAINAAIDVTTLPEAQPTIPIEFGLSFVPAEIGGADAGRLAIVRYDPGSGTCVPLKTRLDAARNMLLARINHLSSFQIMQADPAATLDAPRVFPNPVYMRNQGYVTFDRMPAYARVRVYTLRGEEVFDERANASGILIWPATNKDHRRVGSGLYVAVIEANGRRQVLKVAVIR